MARSVPLERRLSSRIAAAACGIVLALAALAWLGFCLTMKPGPDAAPGAQILLYALSLVSIPMLLYVRLLLLDALTGGELVVRDDDISIILPRILRRPISLGRAAVAGAIIDEEPVSNGDERLRFPIGADSAFLYSSISGSALPILSPERVLPNLAIVFEQPLQFPEPRRRALGAEQFSPLHPLEPSSPAAGVLLRVTDPTRAARILATWSDSARVHQALRAESERPPGGLPDGTHRNMPSLRRPLSSERVASLTRWSSVPLIGAIVAVVYAGRHASFTPGRVALLLVGFALLLSGGVLDTRLRYQERGGLPHLASMGLAAIGIMIAIAVTVLATYHS